MRVAIAVTPAAGGDFTVEAVRDPEGEREPLGTHTMCRLEAAPWVAPMGGNVPPPALVGDAKAAGALFARLAKDRPAPGDVELIGRYLFDALLGRQLWDEIVTAAAGEATTIELALSWPAEALELHRLWWEALHEGRAFLGAHPELAVAITRVVADAPKATRLDPIQAPARVLFVLGADLDDAQIRAGAEVLGLLRDAERGKGAIDASVLEAATIGGLERRCRRFRPHIVHFVSHGRMSPRAGGQLELRPDEGDDGWVGAEQLLGALRVDGALPGIVVLTGCESGATGKHTDSLATELVRHGVPCVVGMSGKISDPVCRLFTRRFGSALNEGEPLVEALTHARRAGLRRQERDPADDLAWALPSVFMAPGLTAAHAPVDVENASAVLARFREYGLMCEPVFCGRSRFGRDFDRLLDPDDRLELLVAYATDREHQGKTRLLHEFAGRALRAGHVVVMVDDLGNDISKLPHTPLELAVEMLGEVARTRQRFKLPPPVDSVLLEELERVTGKSAGLAQIASEPGQWARLDSFRAECVAANRDEGGIAGSLRNALSADLIRLIGEARGSPDASVGPQSKAVAILGGIGNWGTATDLITSAGFFDARGLGNDEEHVPVFATCALPDAETRLTEARERARVLPWAHYEKLGPFCEGEDTLAYRWVLLHPRAAEQIVPLPAYAPNFGPDGNEEIWERRLRKYVKGIPGNFEDAVFEAVVEDLHERKVLLEADDEAVLAEYLQTEAGRR